MLRCNVAIHVVGVLLRLTDLGGEHHKCGESRQIYSSTPMIFPSCPLYVPLLC